MLLLHVHVEVFQNILKLRSWPFVFTLNKTFQKRKRGLELVSLPHFLHNFWRKIFFTFHSLNWPNFIACLSLLLVILCNMCIATVYWPGCDVISFEINLIFLIKSFFYLTKKSRQKCKYLKNEKTFWHEIKSLFYNF